MKPFLNQTILNGFKNIEFYKNSLFVVITVLGLVHRLDLWASLLLPTSLPASALAATPAEREACQQSDLQ